MFRLFHLERLVDDSGVSGSGRVAEGCVLNNGMCILEWLVHKDHGFGVYTSLQELEKVHGHNGHTLIVFDEIK